MRATKKDKNPRLCVKVWTVLIGKLSLIILNWNGLPVRHPSWVAVSSRYSDSHQTGGRWAADDYVIATGEAHSVRDFAAAAFGIVGLDWRKHVRVDRTFRRPAEVSRLLGDASKAHRKLQWRAHTKFHDLVKIMVEADLARV